ncbi:MAG: LysR family transcriptional regulator [Burkholderiales bacterium]|nr:LysR family transcriptional regulator [Burkholderiales bacterium]
MLARPVPRAGMGADPIGRMQCAGSLLWRAIAKGAKHIHKFGYIPHIRCTYSIDSYVVIMTTTRFRQVLVVAETGSFSRAAAALKISQPALTKAVQAVEKELGVRLFDRQPRGVTLTEFGTRVVAYARDTAHAEDDLVHDLALLAGLETGRLSVALGPYPSVVSGYAAAARLIGQHPRLGIALRVTNWRVVTQAVVDRKADLGIAELADAMGNEGLTSEPVGSHRARFFCRPEHPILRRERATFADLLEFPWATTRIPSRIAAAFPRSLGRAGKIDDASGDFVPAIELDVPMQIASFVGASDVLAIGGLAMVERELHAGVLDLVANTEVDMRARYGFLWLRHRSLSPAALAYMQAVREEERLFGEREACLAATYERRRGVRRSRPRVRP